MRFLLGGGFGGPTVIALDRQGRTLAYGAGRGSMTDFEVCPGGRRSVETAWIEGRRTLYVRDLRSMLVRYRVKITGEAVSCRTPDARGGRRARAQAGGGGERFSRLVHRLCLAAGAGAITARPGPFSVLTWADSASLVARSFDPTPTPIGVLDSRLRTVAGCPDSTKRSSPPARPGGST